MSNESGPTRQQIRALIDRMATPEGRQELNEEMIIRANSQGISREEAQRRMQEVGAQMVENLVRNVPLDTEPDTMN